MAGIRDYGLLQSMEDFRHNDSPMRFPGSVHPAIDPLLAFLWPVALFGASTAGCQATGWPGLQSRNPVTRARTAVAIAEARDLTGVPALVSSLEDDDPAVRMYAILALHQLVGEDFGYRYYSPESERLSAVEAWRQALREGRVAGTGPAPASSAPVTASETAEIPTGPAESGQSATAGPVRRTEEHGS